MSSQLQGSQRVNKRVGGPTSKQEGTLRSAEPDAEEESVMRSLLPCVLSIGGLSLFLWLLGYFLIPSRPNMTTTPYADRGNVKCTQIKDVKELILELREMQDWMPLGQELRIDQSHLDHWKADITEPELRLRAVLRDWYSNDADHCWETMWSALQAVGHGQLAESIAVKHKRTIGASGA